MLVQLRHTYLRVLHPLLTRTQLRSIPYKRPQIVHVLESLISHPSIRDINPTTKRLVERCLSGDWCVQLRKMQSPTETGSSLSLERLCSLSPTSEDTLRVASTEKNDYIPSSSPEESRQKPKLKSSRSAENLRASPTKLKPHLHGLEKPTNSSSLHLPGTTGLSEPTSSPPTLASMPVPSSHHQKKTRSTTSPRSPPPPPSKSRQAGSSSQADQKYIPVRAGSLPSPIEGIVASTPIQTTIFSASASNPSLTSVNSTTAKKSHQSAPPTPPKRRKPPAVPTTSGGGARITAISSSKPSSLSRVPPISPN